MSARPAATYHGLVRFFVVPAAVIAANWAALLAALSVLALVPGLAGAARVLTGMDEHQDSAFRSVLKHVAVTWRRDLPVTAGSWLLLLAVLGNGALVTTLDPAPRTFLVGLLVPVLWVLLAWISAYVALASDAGATRSELTLAATRALATRLGRALLAPAVIIALCPLWLLAPITLACGLSVPPYLLASLWGRRIAAPAA